MREFKQNLMFVCYRKNAKTIAVQLERCKTTGGRFEREELGESVDTEPSLVPPLPKPERMTGGQWKKQWIMSEKL